MKTYSEIVANVRDGLPVTQEELQYALTAVHFHHMQLYFDLARFFAVKDQPLERDKTEKRLQHHFEQATHLSSRDLEAYLKGSSLEPGISRDERNRRANTKIAEAAVDLHTVLTGLRDRKA